MSVLDSIYMQKLTFQTLFSFSKLLFEFRETLEKGNNSVENDIKDKVGATSQHKHTDEKKKHL